MEFPQRVLRLSARENVGIGGTCLQRGGGACQGFAKCTIMNFLEGHSEDRNVREKKLCTRLAGIVSGDGKALEAI